MGLRLNIKVYTQEGNTDKDEHGYEINVTRRLRELTEEQGLAFGTFMADIVSDATNLYFGSTPAPSGEAGYQSKCCDTTFGPRHTCDHISKCDMQMMVGMFCRAHRRSEL